VLDVVDRVADTDTTVLLTGASGTGKEVIARALHERSLRADRPFIAVNCAALPEQLLESELFGYRKGAFTDARANKEGLFRSAEGGTLFLDELGEMPLSLQPKLLRVLQEREITPIGANRPEPIDVRVVAATNQDIEALVRERRFREDLFYRLNVIRIDLPPLGVRPEDVLPMAESFLKRTGERLGRHPVLSKAAQTALLAYSWPGNVRELQNAIERAVALCRTPTIEVTDLPVAISRPSASALVETSIQRGLTLEQLTTEYCAAVVRTYGGNQSAAARHLDIDRKTLAKKLHLTDDGIDATGS
jgi:two-component system response regulator HydG